MQKEGVVVMAKAKSVKIKLPPPSKKAGSKKDRQMMAHRAKHARYLREGRMEKNKARRALTQKHREEKQRAKKLLSAI